MKIIFDHLYGHVENERVFCEAFAIPEGETEDELLELGFLPNIQPPLYWYQSRSCRINNNNITLSSRRKKLLSKLSFEIEPFSKIVKEVDLFFFNYYLIKKFDLIDQYNLNSKIEFLKILKVKLGNEVLAYVRFKEFNKSLLVFEVAMVLNQYQFSLGKDSFLLLSDYGKSKSKNFVYIYESYKNHFNYKNLITGSEYWEGEKWISNNI